MRIPVLMVNAHHDCFFQIETSQLPPYRMLGAPTEAKRHLIYEGGHTVPRAVLMRETQDWLDRWLGPTSP